jgi:hypothetical protein
MNGKLCVVKGGFDRETTKARLHCTQRESGESVRLKMSNLLPLSDASPLGSFMSASSHIPYEKLIKYLQKALCRHHGDADRDDLSCIDCNGIKICSKS